MLLENAKRGTKRVCPACNTRFYDLLREVDPMPLMRRPVRGDGRGCGASSDPSTQDGMAQQAL